MNLLKAATSLEKLIYMPLKFGSGIDDHYNQSNARFYVLLGGGGPY